MRKKLTVANDYTISWWGQLYRIPLEQARARLRKTRIRVEQRLDSTLVARFEGKELALTICAKPSPPEAVKHEGEVVKIARPKRTKPNRNWMTGFVMGDPLKSAERKQAQSSPAGSRP